MNRVINLGMLSHPLNWITLAIWLLLFGFVLSIFDTKLQSTYPATKQ